MGPSLPATLPRLRDVDAFKPGQLEAAIEQFLMEPRSVLTVSSEDLIRIGGAQGLKHQIRLAYQSLKPSLGDAMIKGYGAQGMDYVLQLGQQVARSTKHAWVESDVQDLVYGFDIERQSMSFTDQDKSLFRVAAAMAASGQYDKTRWMRVLALMVWNEGQSFLEPRAKIANKPRIPEAQRILTEFLSATLPRHRAFLAEIARDHSRSVGNAMGGGSSGNADQAWNTGARWMTADDVRASPTFSAAATAPGLLIGHDPAGGAPIYYSGHESLITIGGPGSGKSQSQVIPNLLTFPGSAVVLDVKGELYDATSKWRERYGPVYRFAPSDPDGQTHCYNVFDHISTDPDVAADQCTIFSYQVILENPKLTDPFWENRGRDMLWAFALLVALDPEPANRTMARLGELLSNPTTLDPVSDLPDEIMVQWLDYMAAVGNQYGISDLAAASRAIRSGLGTNTLNSVFDTARRYISPFGRSRQLVKALARSDWSPLDLRRRPTTVYLCLSPAELKSYGAVVRAILMQHQRMLMNYKAKHTEVPITFFLDEMPQLGNFESILEMQDVGRGAGLRLWMFAQNLGQLHKAFGSERYKGVIDSCRVRCFMAPDSELSQFLQSALGETRNTFHGTREPLAPPSDLMGARFGNKVITVTRGEHPLVLDKKPAYLSMADRMLPPTYPAPIG